MVSVRMMPPTRLRKIAARSHRPIARSRSCGTRYDGSSSSSACSLRSRRQRFITHDTSSALVTPAAYNPNRTRPCRLSTPATSRRGMNAPISSAYTGSRAEHVISGLQAADAGRWSLDGTDLTGASPEDHARAGLIRTFQMVRSYDDLTVLDNIKTLLASDRVEYLD